MAVIMSRQIVVQKLIVMVEITTERVMYETECYVVINNTTYREPTNSIKVVAGDVITFYIRSCTVLADATLNIDGVTVVSANNTSKTYVWTVPDGITSILMYLYSDVDGYAAYNIDVTTS